MSLRAIICVAAGLLLCTGASAQPECNHILRGEVVELHNHEPVYPALVTLTGTGKGAETDTAGGFRIEGLCAGRYAYRLKAIGFGADSGFIVLGGDTAVHLHLSHSPQSLQNVTVTDERVRTVLQAHETIKREEILAQSGKTLADVLKTVNGVNTFNNGATIAKPVIHGLHSNRILMLNNGIRQEDQQWGGEHAPDIDPFLANNLTVIKGAAGVRYGTDAMGGVILVEPAALRSTPGTDGEVNLSAFSNNRMGVAEGMIEHNFRKVPQLSVRLQGTLKRGGNYRVPGYWAANTGVSETNFSGTAGWRGAHHTAEVFYSHFDTDIGIYRGSHTGSREDLLAAINSDHPLIPADFTFDIDRPKQHVSHDLLKMKATADTRAGLWSIVYGYQHNFRQEYDVQRKETGLAQLNLTLNTQTLNVNLDLRQKGGFSGQVGVDGIYQQNFIRDGDRPFIPNYNGYGAAAYAIERWRKRDWTLEGGLRYDDRWYDLYNADGPNGQVSDYHYNYNSLSGTLGVQRRMSDRWNWSATLSNAWRAPQAAELFSAGLHQGAARIEVGDKNLVPEQSYGLNLETSVKASKVLSVDVSAYSQYIRNFIYLEPGPDLLTIRGYYKTFNYRQTAAWLNGADITATAKWNAQFSSILRGSFLFARNTTVNDWLIQIPADRVSLSLNYERKLSGVFQDIHAGVTGRYVFQQTRVPANFDVLDYPRPPAAYFLLDAEVGSKVMAWKHPLHVSLSVTNALNARYRDYLDAFRYFLDQPGTDVALRVQIPLSF